VVLKGNRIFRHPLFRINHTTYDLRRETDSINPQTAHWDIMLLADRDGSEKHLFCYARILGIYHANVIYVGPGTRDYQSRRQNFLWVCWFELLPDQHSGWQHTALDRARFVSMDRADAFGFVDPADVLQCCHLIPSFADGRLHPNSIATSCNARESEDWKVYYINR
ncbi:hypothetical protein PISMIDRAFT_96528, partial [Pisolithus microcarpus 441]